MAFIAEYVWLGGKNTHTDFRSKCRTMYGNVDLVPLSQYPVWNYDGSSTGQHRHPDTEVLIKPVAKFPHPFTNKAVLVVCETYYADGTPTPCNTRVIAEKVFSDHKALQPWFGLEQEYLIVGPNGRPLGWPAEGYPAPQGPYYCGTGRHVKGREIALHHYEACLKVGLKISGINAEVLPGQWEFQVGPCEGIESGDQMFVARYLLHRVAELHDVTISFDPKPIRDGDWNGSGCHSNFSTAAHRAPGGYTAMLESIERLGRNFLNDIPFYGDDNQHRLTGKHETSPITEFTWGVGTRHTSIRVPNEAKQQGHGYFEDRRPAANIDPYIVTTRILTSSEGLPEPGFIAPAGWRALSAPAHH